MCAGRQLNSLSETADVLVPPRQFLEASRYPPGESLLFVLIGGRVHGQQLQRNTVEYIVVKPYASQVNSNDYKDH
jgi:hypothetical protein